MKGKRFAVNDFRAIPDWNEDVEYHADSMACPACKDNTLYIMFDSVDEVYTCWCGAQYKLVVELECVGFDPKIVNKE